MKTVAGSPLVPVPEGPGPGAEARQSPDPEVSASNSPSGSFLVAHSGLLAQGLVPPHPRSPQL